MIENMVMNDVVMSKIHFLFASADDGHDSDSTTCAFAKGCCWLKDVVIDVVKKRMTMTIMMRESEFNVILFCVLLRWNVFDFFLEEKEF